MGNNSIDFSGVVKEDEKKTGTSTSGSPNQIRVKMNFGTKEFSSDRDDCVQCERDMDCVVVVDEGPRKGTRLNRYAIPCCSEHLNEVAMAESEEGNKIRVKE